jgi:hypothetical protein
MFIFEFFAFFVEAKFCLIDAMSFFAVERAINLKATGSIAKTKLFLIER